MEATATTTTVDIRTYGLQEGILFNKKVTLMPVPRAGAMISDKNHIGYWHFDGSQMSFDLPISRSRGGLIPILNTKELEYFGRVFGEDLNFNKRENNFWKTNPNGKVTINIDKNFKEKGLDFDLSDPMDNFKWRVLKIQQFISETWEGRFDRAEYSLAFMESDYQESDKLNKMQKMQKAYKFVSKLDTSRPKMYDFLCVYWMQNIKAKRPEQDAPKEVLGAMIQDIIETNIDSFIAVSDDANYENKLFVHRAMTSGYIDRQGVRGDYTVDGRFLGKTIDDAIRNLLSPEWHDDYLRVKALMDAHKTVGVTTGTVGKE